MPKVTEAQARYQLETIARKISQGYTDSEIMQELHISRGTYYNYKSKMFKIWGDIAAKKTEQSLEFEAEILKDRLTRLHRMMEVGIGTQGPTLGEKAHAAEVAAELAITAFKLEAEGLRQRQGRAIQIGEQKAVGYLRSIQPGIQEPDKEDPNREGTTTATTESESEPGNQSQDTTRAPN